VIYRDDRRAAEARLDGLRADVTALALRPEAVELVRLRADLRHARRRLARTRRAAARLRHPLGRLAPRSVVEAVVAAAAGLAASTLALGIFFVAVWAVSMIQIGC
jgi:hypothetical protein